MKKKVSNKKEDKILREVENLALTTSKGFEDVHKEIENLALITGKGFEEVNGRLDGHDKKFVDIDGQFKVVVNELMRLGDEVKDVKGTVLDLVHMSAGQDKENRKIIFRLDHLENRAATRWEAKKYQIVIHYQKFLKTIN